MSQVACRRAQGAGEQGSKGARRRAQGTGEVRDKGVGNLTGPADGERGNRSEAANRKSVVLAKQR